MKIILTNKARKDINDIFDYIANYSIKAAIKTNKNIRSYIEQLEKLPYIGRYVPEIPNKQYRERICKNYRIIYFISQKDNTIYILYIFNARQDVKSFYNLHIKDFFYFYFFIHFVF